MYRKVTDQERQKIIQSYQEIGSINKVAKAYDRSTRTIKRILEDGLVETRPVGHPRRDKLAEGYFDRIDSPEKAFWLGYVMMNGQVQGRRIILDFQHVLVPYVALLAMDLSLDPDALILERDRARLVINSAGVIKAMVRYEKQENPVPPDLYGHYCSGIIWGISTGRGVKKRSRVMEPLLDFLADEIPEIVSPFDLFDDRARQVFPPAKMEIRKDWSEDDIYTYKHGRATITVWGDMAEMYYEDPADDPRNDPYLDS